MEFSTLHDTLRTSPAMSACPIPALSAVTTLADTPTPVVTVGEQAGLLDALSAVPDPRAARGVRYPFAGLLAVAVCAVLAGASSFAAIADWRPDLDDIARARLGFVRGVPAATTVWRLLIRLDADLLATVLAGWLRTQARPVTPRRRRYRIVIAIDGKTLRAARRPDGSQVHLLSALDTSTGIVLAQVTVATKSTEIPAFRPLLNAVETVLGSLDGLLFVADAMHTQTSHANEIAARGGHLLIRSRPTSPPCSPSSRHSRGRRSRPATAPATAATAAARPAPSKRSPSPPPVGSPSPTPNKPSGSPAPAPSPPAGRPAAKPATSPSPCPPPTRARPIYRTGPAGMAHRESRPPRPGCHVP
jgi:DDE_Tnp_1-associated/Transposase DDE domain